MKTIFDPQFSAFLLRISMATVLLAHSVYLKLVVFTLPGTAQYFVSIGLPEIMAYVVFYLEMMAGFALLLGFATRFFAALIIPVLLGATWVHLANGWLFTNTGGGWEYPLVLMIIAMAQIGLGPGKYHFTGSLKLPLWYYAAGGERDE